MFPLNLRATTYVCWPNPELFLLEIWMNKCNVNISISNKAQHNITGLSTIYDNMASTRRSQQICLHEQFFIFYFLCPLWGCCSQISHNIYHSAQCLSFAKISMFCHSWHHRYWGSYIIYVSPNNSELLPMHQQVHMQFDAGAQLSSWHGLHIIVLQITLV